MSRRAELAVVSFAALWFAACGPASSKNPDAGGDDTPDAQPACQLVGDLDGDTIRDCDDGTGDFDMDTVPNNMDTDSDGDGYPDSVEAGDADLNTLPADFDNDGRPNFLDLDSDNDGLLDADELSAGTDPLDTDSDDDGFSDLVEVTIHELCVMNPSECNGDPDPLDPNQNPSPLDYFFILPYQDPEQRKPLDFATNIGQADIHFSMDTTFSMNDEITNLRTGVANIVTQVSAEIPSSAFGVSRYEDFPVNGYGVSPDVPFEMHQRVTTNTTLVQAGVNALSVRNGSDVPESGWEALYRIATGNLLSWNGGSIAAFNPNAGYDPATNGLLGGVGFRDGSLPIVVHITDARSHDTVAVSPSCGGSSDTYSTAFVTAHGKATTFASLIAANVRVVGVSSLQNTGGCSPRGDLEEVATATGALVGPDAWGPVATRPAGCPVTQCCTGTNGAGRVTDGTGMCPLVFDVTANGAGLGAAVIAGIKALVNFAVIDVSAGKDSVPQPNAFGTLTDPQDFITDILPISLNPVPPGGVQLDPTGHIFLDVQPGTIATFDVKAENTILMQAADPQVFTLKIRVIGDGITILDTRQVVIIVPPAGSVIE
jgi:hypothetical protein